MPGMLLKSRNLSWSGAPSARPQSSNPVSSHGHIYTASRSSAQARSIRLWVLMSLRRYTLRLIVLPLLFPDLC
jgi:hypothetical protein